MTPSVTSKGFLLSGIVPEDRAVPVLLQLVRLLSKW